jgi:hypothetical protein
MPFYGKSMKFINEKSKRDKIFSNYRRLEDTIVEMADCFIKKGWIEDKVTVFDGDTAEEKLIGEKPQIGIGKSVDLEIGVEPNTGAKGGRAPPIELDLTADARDDDAGTTGQWKIVGDLKPHWELEVK